MNRRTHKKITTRICRDCGSQGKGFICEKCKGEIEIHEIGFPIESKEKPRWPPYLKLSD